MKRKIKLLVYLILIGLTNHAFADYPLVSYRYLADPGALVYNGRVYLYCSNDDDNEVDGGYEINGVSVGKKFAIKAKTVVNTAGLFSDRVAEMLGIDVEEAGYRLHLCKGDYFRVVGKPPIKMLVYPVPKGPGLGIHLTPDLAGAVRLGPNAYYVEEADYRVESSEEEFRGDVKRFLPCISKCQLVSDFAGIRPKLQGPGQGFKDFVIRHEVNRDLFGFVNLIGIESPGLTAAPSIGEFVAELYDSEIQA